MSLLHRCDLSLSNDLIYLNVTGDCWKAEKKWMYHQLIKGGDINLTALQQSTMLNLSTETMGGPFLLSWNY